jgi:hypothetical protein
MAKIDLGRLYRQATAASDAALDVDTLARLAAGEHLGARHDAVVAELAGSAVHARALQVAMDAIPLPEAEAVAHVPRRWAALAAGLAAAFVVLVMNAPRVEGPSAQANDRILNGNFEDGVVQASASGDQIFRDDDSGA